MTDLECLTNLRRHYVDDFGVLATLQNLVIKQKEPIVEWLSSNVDMSCLPTASASGPVKLSPYQIEPLEASEQSTTREITLMWGQRLGKSTIWEFSLLKRCHDGGLAGLIIYPSLELGQKMNKDFVLPLLRSRPNLKSDLAAIGGKKKESYNLPSARSVIYFLGGGSQVVSYTANWGVLDEADFIKVDNADAEGANVDQIRSLRLRMQTYADRLLIVCSSPTNHGGAIYQNWQKGSRGIWNLRCLHCGALHPSNQLAFRLDDGSFAGLQWDKTESGDIIEDSIHWICPTCKHIHVYADALEMNRRGCYVHDNPDKLEHRSYQAGALANPNTWTWREIAEKQEEATDPDGKKFLANTIKGMPYKHTREGDLSLSISDVLTSKKITYPKDLSERLAIVCAGIDQQAIELAGAKYYVYAVRGWDDDGNSWLLNHGLANNLDELHNVVSSRYWGHQISFALMDAGGFDDNSSRTDPFLKSHKNIWYYKGGDDRTNSLKGQPWRLSSNITNLILANAIHYQVILLDALYGAIRPKGYRFYIPENISEAYINQMAAMQPNNRMKAGTGEIFANWTPNSVRHDFFDAEKMSFCALHVACHFIGASQFCRGHKPIFYVREKMLEMVRMKKEQNITPA